MNELQQFLQDFYGKYAPNVQLDSAKIQAIQERYGDDYDGLINDLYGKYSPRKSPDQNRLQKIKETYNLGIQKQNAEAVTDLAAQYEAPEPTLMEEIGKKGYHFGKSLYSVGRHDIPAAALGAADYLSGSAEANVEKQFESGDINSIIAKLQVLHPEMSKEEIEANWVDLYKQNKDALKPVDQTENQAKLETIDARSSQIFDKIYSEWAQKQWNKIQTAHINREDEEEVNAVNAKYQQDSAAFAEKLRHQLALFYEPKTKGIKEELAKDSAAREIAKTQVVKDRLKTILKSKEIREQGAEFKADLTTRLDQVKDLGDALDWAFAAFGQASGQIPLAAATGGTSSFMQEIGNIHLDGVQKIADEEGISIEEVIRTNKDASLAPLIYGTAAAALDRIGAKGIMSQFGKKAVYDAVKKNTIARIITNPSVKEGITEGAQTVLEQIGVSKVADMSWEETFHELDWKEVGEAAAQGLIGSGPMTAAGAVAQSRSEAAQKKLTDTLNKKTVADIEKEEAAADDLIDQATATSPQAAEVKAVVESATDDITDTDDEINTLVNELVAQQKAEEGTAKVEELKETEETLDKVDTKVEAGKLSPEDDIKAEKAYTEQVKELDRLKEAGEISPVVYDYQKAELDKSKTAREELKKKLAAEEAAKQAAKKTSGTKAKPGVQKTTKRAATNKAKAPSKPATPAKTETPKVEAPTEEKSWRQEVRESGNVYIGETPLSEYTKGLDKDTKEYVEEVFDRISPFKYGDEDMKKYVAESADPEDAGEVFDTIGIVDELKEQARGKYSEEAKKQALVEIEGLLENLHPKHEKKVIDALNKVKADILKSNVARKLASEEIPTDPKAAIKYIHKLELKRPLTATEKAKLKAATDAIKKSQEKPAKEVKPEAPKEEKQKWYWVVGNEKKGYTVTDKKPTGKNVMEPFRSPEEAEIGRRNLITSNINARLDAEEKAKKEKEKEADLGPAESLYKPKKKPAKKAEPKKSTDSLKDLAKEVTSDSEKAKVKSLQAHRAAIEKVVKKPSYESIQELEKAQKALKKEIEKGSKGDASYLEIRRELNKLEGAIEQLKAGKEVKQIIKEGKKAEKKTQKDETTEQTAKRELGDELDERDENLRDDEPFDEYTGGERMASSIRGALHQLRQALTPNVYVPTAAERDSIKHAAHVYGTFNDKGEFLVGDEFIETLEFVDESTIEARIPDHRPGYRNDFINALKLVNKLRAMNGLPPVKVFISPNPITNKFGTEVSGFYVGGKTSSIVLGANTFSNPAEQHTALHEVIHPITHLFKAISDLKISHPSFNNFKKDLNETFKNVKDQVATIIDDLLGERVELQDKHRAFLEAVGALDVDHFYSIISDPDTNIKNPKSHMGKLVYGLTNPSEMVSEAFSNPKFANLLLNLRDDNSKTVAKNNHTVLWKIANNIVEFLNTMYEKVFNTKGTSFGRVMDLMTEFEKAMASGALQYDYLSETILRKEEVAHIDFKKAKAVKFPQATAQKIVDRAIDQNILTQKGFKEYLDKISLRMQAAGGQPLNSAQRKQLNALFKLDANIDQLLLDNRRKVMASLPNSTRYNNKEVTHYAEQVDEFLDIKDSELEAKDKRKYYVVLKALQKEQIHPNIARILTKYHGLRKTEAIADTNGIGYRELASGAYKIKNAAQLVTQMAKSFTKNADKLFETFYYDIMRAGSRAQLKTKKLMDELIDIVNKNGLTNEDYLKVGIFGVGLRSEIAPNMRNAKYIEEIEKNIDYLKETQKMKAKAVGNVGNQIGALFSSSNENRWTQADIAKENKIIEDFERAFKSGNLQNFLNDGQRELYDAFRGQLEASRPDLKENTLAYWNDEHHGKDTQWEEWYDYFPSRVAGRDEKAVVNDEADQFQNLITREVNNFKNLSALQSRFSRKFTGSKSVYLDLNVLSVANAYHNAVNYDLHATKYLRMLNSTLRNNKTKDKLGARNVQVIMDSLAAHVKATTGRNYNFHKVVRAAEDLKSKFVTAKLGHVGQWFNQWFGQQAAINAFTGGNGVRAFKELIRTPNGTSQFERTYGQSFEEWINENGAGLQIRDMFFEVDQTVQQFAKSTVSGSKAGQIRDWADRSTRHALTTADKLAARQMFLAAFYEAGGDVRNPSKEALAHAERKTILSQNVSDLSFAPTMFRPESSMARIALSIAMPFKSFAWQQMWNTLGSFRDMKQSPEARKLFAANVLSSLGYTAVNAVIVKALYSAIGQKLLAPVAAAAMEALGEDEWAEALMARDDEDEEKAYSTTAGVLINTAYDLFFGGLPVLAEQVLKGTINETVVAPIQETRSGKSFDDYRDTPLFTSKEAESLLGGYEDIYRLGKVAGGGIVHWTTEELAEAITGRVNDKGDDLKMSDWYRLVFIDALSAVPYVPFRGDFVKGNRELVQELKEYEFEQKRYKASPRKDSRPKIGNNRIQRRPLKKRR